MVFIRSNMKIGMKTLLMILIILLMPLSGCVSDESNDGDTETNTNQENVEILFEGDEPGECSDQSDNDRDGLFDCDDPNCYGAEICRLNNENNSSNYSQEDCERRGGNWTSAPDRDGEYYCRDIEDTTQPEPMPCSDAPDSDVSSQDFIERFNQSDALMENSTFRIVLLTSCKTNLTDDAGIYDEAWNHADKWNRFVLNSYYNSGSLLGEISWSAIVATPEASVQDNTGYLDESNIPVFNGVAEQVFDNGEHFYQTGPWKENIGHTDNGGQGSTNNNGIDSFAWTGSHVNGSAHSTYSLQEINANNTDALMTGYAWFSLDHHNFEWTSRSVDEHYRVYSLSEPVQLINGTEIIPLSSIESTVDQPISTCGDGIVDQNEECDDGNTEGGDGCSASCQQEQQSYCGDGMIDQNEECDDGNTEGGDGCSASCQQEDPCANTECDPGWTCDGDGNCQPPADGTACDDGDPSTTSDMYHNGQCKGTPIVCPDGQSVNNDGECVCPENQTYCGGECVDCNSDENNCGGCYQVCDEGYECQNGECVYVGVTHYINISNMEYEFSTLTINVLDTVVWTNQETGMSHTVTNDSNFDSGNIPANGGTWSYQFTTAGTYEYYCAYHSAMVAEIVVV